MATQESWYQVIRDVVVQGSPEAIGEAAGLWEAQIRRIQSVADALRAGIRDQPSAWNSPAGVAFAAHLEQMAADVDALCGRLSPVTGMLAQAREDLVAAQRAIPIPAKFSDAVVGAHAAFMATGRADLSLLSDGLASGVDQFRSAFGDSDEKAVAAARILDGQYKTTGAAASPDQRAQIDDWQAHNYDNGTGDSQTPSGVAGLGTGGGPGSGDAGGPGPSSVGGRGDSSRGSTAGTRFDSSGIPTDPWEQFRHGTGTVDADSVEQSTRGVERPGGNGTDSTTGVRVSGLAGAGNEGLSGAGTGTGGFGAGLTPSTELGPLVGPKGDIGAGSGGTGSRLAAATGAGAGTGAGMPGVGMGSPGPGAGNEANTHETWLKEDDDVWGLGDLPGISGSVLGGGAL